MIKFQPPVGELCLITILTHEVTRFLYAYRDDPDNPNHFKVICSVTDFVAGPFDYEFTVSEDQTNQEHNSHTRITSIRYAHSVLYAMRRLWSNQDEDFESWVTKLIADERLPKGVRLDLSTLR